MREVWMGHRPALGGDVGVAARRPANDGEGMHLDSATDAAATVLALAS